MNEHHFSIYKTSHDSAAIVPTNPLLDASCCSETDRAFVLHAQSTARKINAIAGRQVCGWFFCHGENQSHSAIINREEENND